MTSNGTPHVVRRRCASAPAESGGRDQASVIFEAKAAGILAAERRVKSGKRFTLEQVKFYMGCRKQRRTQTQASAKAGVSEGSARRIEHVEVGVSQSKVRH